MGAARAGGMETQRQSRSWLSLDPGGSGKMVTQAPRSLGGEQVEESRATRLRFLSKDDGVVSEERRWEQDTGKLGREH